MVATTYDGLGGGPFDPAGQDRLAWKLAQTDFKGRTGKDLDQELASNGLSDMVIDALNPTWPSMRPNKAKLVADYQASLARFQAGGSMPPVNGPIQPGTVNPITPEDRYRLARVEHERAKTAPGFFGALAESASIDMALSWQMRHRPDLVPDPSFPGLKPEEVQELSKGLPADYREMFAGAYSRGHAEWIATQARERYAAEQRLEAAGWTGTSARLLVGMLDPVNVLTMIGTEGLGAVAMAGKTMSRGSRVLANAGLGGVGNLSGEAVAYGLNPARQASDLLFATASGLALGAAFGPRGAPLRNIEPEAQEIARVASGIAKRADWTVEGAFRRERVRAANDNFDVPVRPVGGEAPGVGALGTRTGQPANDNGTFREAGQATWERGSGPQASESPLDARLRERGARGEARVMDDISFLRGPDAEADHAARLGQATPVRSDGETVRVGVAKAEIDQAERKIADLEAELAAHKTISKADRRKLEEIDRALKDPLTAPSERQRLEKQRAKLPIQRVRTDTERALEIARAERALLFEGPGPRDVEGDILAAVEARGERLRAEREAKSTGQDNDPKPHERKPGFQKVPGPKPPFAAKVTREVNEGAPVPWAERAANQNAKDAFPTPIVPNLHVVDVANDNIVTLRGDGVVLKGPIPANVANDVEGITAAERVAGDAFDPIDGMGAASTPKAGGLETSKLHSGDELDVAAPSADVPAKRYRFDLSKFFGTASHPGIRAFGAYLIEDPLGSRVVGQPASRWKRNMLDRMAVELASVFRPAFDEWRADRGHKGFLWFGHGKARAQFSHELHDFLIGVTPPDEAHKAVQRVAQVIRAQQSKLHDLKVNPGHLEGDPSYRPVAGYSPENKAENYFPTRWNIEAVDRMAGDVGDNVPDVPRFLAAAAGERPFAGMSEFFAYAAWKAMPRLEAEDVLRIGHGFVIALRQRSRGLDVKLGDALSGDDMEALFAILRSSGLGDDEVDVVAKRIHTAITRGEKEAGDASARRKVPLDYTLEADVLGKYGEVQRLTLRQFLDRDALGIHELAMQQGMGTVALARVRMPDELGGLAVNGFTSPEEFERYKAWIRATSTAPKHVLDDQIAAMEFVWRHLKSVPTYDDHITEQYGDILRMVMKLNYVRAMGQVGLAQIPELGRAMGVLGVRAVFEHVPSIRKVIDLAGRLRYSEEYLRDFETHFGIGHERNKQWLSLRDEDQIVYGSRLGPAARKVDGTLDTLAYASNDLSLMNVVNEKLHLMTASAIVQRIVDQAHGVRKGLSEAHIRDLGIDPNGPEWAAVLAEAKKHVSTVRGMWTPVKFKATNLDQWDPAARETLVHAVKDLSQRIILGRDIGADARWQHHVFGKVMTQFRTFPMTAHSKAMLHDINQPDMAGLMTMIYSGAIAAMVYGVQTKLRAVGRSDQEEYEADRLTPAKFGAVAFARGSSSGLMPMAFDTGMAVLQLPPMFDFRSTGLPSDVLFGNPTVSGLNSLMTSLGLPFTSTIRGEGPSQQELRAATALVPLQNVMPMMMLSNALISGRPERAEKFSLTD